MGASCNMPFRTVADRLRVLVVSFQKITNMDQSKKNNPVTEDIEKIDENQSFVKFLLLFLVITGAIFALVDYLFL